MTNTFHGHDDADGLLPARPVPETFKIVTSAGTFVIEADNERAAKRALAKTLGRHRLPPGANLTTLTTLAQVEQAKAEAAGYGIEA